MVISDKTETSEEKVFFKKYIGIRHKTKNALHLSDTTRARFHICYNHTNISAQHAIIT